MVFKILPYGKYTKLRGQPSSSFDLRTEISDLSWEVSFSANAITWIHWVQRTQLSEPWNKQVGKQLNGWDQQTEVCPTFASWCLERAIFFSSSRCSVGNKFEGAWQNWLSRGVPQGSWTKSICMWAVMHAHWDITFPISRSDPSSACKAKDAHWVWCKCICQAYDPHCAMIVMAEGVQYQSCQTGLVLNLGPHGLESTLIFKADSSHLDLVCSRSRRWKYIETAWSHHCRWNTKKEGI